MLSTVVSLTTVERGITKVRKTTVYNMRGVMEICRYSTQPNANAFIDCIYHVIIQTSTLLTHSYPLPVHAAVQL